MDPNNLLRQFDGRSRLLLQSLFSGVDGTSRALRVFRRLRCSEHDFCLRSCLDTLCREEPCVDDVTPTLCFKPMMCLFPDALKCRLLTFLHLVHSMVPRPYLLRFLSCIRETPGHRNDWIRVLLRQLRRDIGLEEPCRNGLFTPECQDRLQLLCKRLVGLGSGARLADAFGNPSGPEPQDVADVPAIGHLQRQQQKRKSDSADLDHVSQQVENQSKRRKLDPLTLQEGGRCEEGSPLGTQKFDTGVSGLSCNEEDVLTGADLQPLQQTPVGPSSAMPDHIKASVSRIKKLLETEAEWDQGSSSFFEVLNECDPSQVELFCEELRLSELPEQTLPQLCACLLALSVDISYSTAAALAKHLFHGKVLSLLEPASRCLVAAIIAFCSRYPRPVCCALIGPVLEAGQMSAVKANLLCRLLEDGLDPRSRLLVLRQTLAVLWDEEVLTVIHALLDSRMEQNVELFSLFITQLCQQASHFTKSTKFAKMLLTVLTKYQNHVSLVHQRSLACCLVSHKTFLKKSLLAALKRISPA